MKIFKILLCAAPALFVACSDGVPTVQDPHSPVVNGQTMSPKDFLNTYCAGKSENATCESIRNAMAKDATKGALPKGW